jgi:hypothetical protein
MFKAKFDIAEFKKGDIVPEDRVKIWASMYQVLPVESVQGNAPIAPAKENHDLNNDGKVDKKDAAIASKIMNEVNKHKRK